jgi:hypothetical protein
LVLIEKFLTNISIITYIMESFRDKTELIVRLKIFVKYTLIFLIVPAVGTFLHELGHYIVAVANGCDAYIAYAYTSTSCGDYNPILVFWLIFAGPLATWSQSLTAFVIMVLYYNKEKRDRISKDLPPLYIFLLAFFSFCIRFVFNAIFYAIYGSSSMDEVRIAPYFRIHPDIIVYGFAIIAAILVIIAIYRIPKYRLTIFFSAIFGAILGYLAWNYWIGPILLPG